MAKFRKPQPGYRTKHIGKRKRGIREVQTGGTESPTPRYKTRKEKGYPQKSI